MVLQGEYGRTPSVFVSSTCYDLKQIRSDIKEFVCEQLGYEAILSEFDSFPLEPEAYAVENCIRVVKHRADLFCLIIGGRYGSTIDSGKSITNLEYINARAKGIPIYVFVSNEILAILPVWEKNKSADYSAVVDSSQLFEFVTELRGNENIWTYGFDSAQDIVKTLRRQIGYLFNDALKIRKVIHKNKLSAKVQELSGNTLKIVIEKPAMWEYLLLGEVLEQTVNQCAEIRHDLTYGFSFGNTIVKTGTNDIIDFMQTKSNGLLNIISNLKILFDDAFPDALGAPGESGDADKIIYVGQKFGLFYEELLKWGLEFSMLYVDEEWIGLVNTISKMWESPASKIEQYVTKYKIGIEEAIQHIKEYEDSSMPEKTVDLSLVFDKLDMNEFNEEIKIIRNKYGIVDQLDS